MKQELKYTKQHEQMVIGALVDYRLDPMNCVAGYNILRYAKNGWLQFKTPEREKLFGSLVLQWYPSDPGYMILRMAKLGALMAKKAEQ